MPLLSLKMSEVMPDARKKELLCALSKIVASVTGKPESYVMVTIENASFSMGGKTPSAAFVDIRGIGGIGGEINRKLSREICDLLAREIAIKPENVYMNFTSIDAKNWGHNGTTFG